MLSKFTTAAIFCLLFVLGANTASAQVTANAGTDQSICFGASVTLGGAPTASGGTPGYTYIWGPSSGLSSDTIANPVATPVVTTIYTVTVTDAALNTAIDTVVITVNPIPTSTFTVSSPVCTGQSATMTYTGNGLANAAYSWNFVDGSNITTSGGNQGPFHATYNTTGLRNLTLSILQNGCRSATTTVPIYVGITPTDSVAITNVGCFGANNGAACAYILNSNGSNQYSWSNGANVQCINNLVAGTYIVTVTDTSGCSASASAIVTQSSSLIVTINITDILCSGGNTGSACVTTTGGTQPYFPYQWSNGGTSGCITGLTATTYYLTVTDSHGCIVFDSAVISQPLGLHGTIIPHIGCAPNSGSVCLSVNSGALPYSYSWSNGATTSCINGVTSGPYTATITDGNGCSFTLSTSVPQPTSLLDSIATTNVTCFGGNNGSICDYVLNGTGPFTYMWSNGATGQCISNLPAGQYYLTVTDANLCTATATTVAFEPPALVDTISSTNANCGSNNGALQVLVYGGTPPYAYNWNTGSTTQIVGGLLSGDYILTITDANGCTLTDTGNVMQTSTLLDSIAVTNASCAGGNTGGLCAYVLNGTPAYTYMWSNGQTGQCIGALAPGGYNLTVTDSHGCTATAFNTIIQTQLIDSITVSNVGCFGDNSGSACNYVLNGTQPFTYAWTGGATTQCITNLAVGVYFLTVTDANLCTATASGIVSQASALTVIDSSSEHAVLCNGGTTQACIEALGGTFPYTYNWSNGVFNRACLDNTPAGTYTCTITDANMCSATITEVITEPTALALSFSHTDALCYNGPGSVCVTISGGTTPYNLAWSTGATLSCVTDLWAGIYIANVSDNNGCFVSGSDTIGQPATAIALQVVAPDSNAVPDSVSLIISGGVTPYFINWNDGQGSNSIPDSTAAHVYFAPGVYTDSITDANGCVTTYQVDAGCSDQCVWPGDANYDGMVDNNDLLAIGVGYDSTGYPRTNPTINFIPQYCQSWADTLIGAVNYKHVDCNGDGVINANDTAAVVLNYSLTHARGASAHQWRDGAPALYIKTTPDTISDGEILTATLSLGSAAQPVSNVYALAFTYNFDPQVVDTNSVNINFGDSWLFGAGDHISISKTFYPAGQVQAAATRINHVNRSGYGNICTISMKITTGNINGKNLQYYLMNNFISGLTVIDNGGQALVVNEGTDSAVVSYTPTGIFPVGNANNHIQVYPNPATDQLNIFSTQAAIEDISIVDITGQQVIHQNTQVSNTAINISGLSAGVYIVKLKTATGEYRSRFVKVGNK